MTTLTTMSIEELMGTPYFRSKRDKAICDNGGFYCEACLVGRPASEQSPDLRYCQGCYDYLMKEAEILPPDSRPKWKPKKDATRDTAENVAGGTQRHAVGTQNKRESGTKLQSVKPPAPEEKSIFVPQNTKEISAKNRTLARGRKPKQLPLELIYQLDAEGKSSRDIASRLERKNIMVSYKTIQRLLSGN